MKKFLFLTIIFTLFLPQIIAAEEVVGDSVNFYIQSQYDSLGREETEATLLKISSRAYWYLDNQWWEDLSESQKEELTEALDSLANEFDSKIYPVLAGNFGSEWKPGIDKDSRITILIHPMIEEAGGYFNSGDEYFKSQIPTSNEREMIYLNSLHITEPRAKTLLAHEFQHLISFNQKEKIHNVSEEVWLNEARSEYVPTLLGYNDEFEGSNLQRRISNFLDKPYDSLTEWKNLSYDYGVVNLFIHYLVDHYGPGILVNSLQNSKTGIESLNLALSNGGFSQDFSQIFTDWTIAVLINDCSVFSKYCYLNQNLKSFKSSPLINYLPSLGESVLSVTDTTKDWSGNWHKFVGGNGVLELEFSGHPESSFKVPYVIQDSSGNFSVDFLVLDENQTGTIYIEDFGSENLSLTIIPSLQNKTSGFSDLEPSVSFFWSASTVKEKNEEEEELIIILLAQIEELQRQIAMVRAQIDDLLGIKTTTCQRLEENLYYGMRNDEAVKCLQQFLKSQGQEIYPEELVTGNFLSLTRMAVIRFQEKYKEEILSPLGLEEGTGFVGSMTRAKINQLLTI